MALFQSLQCCSSLPHYIPTANKPKSKPNHNAHQPLDESPPPSSTFAWNSLLRSHLAGSRPSLALLSFRSMLHYGACPDNHTIPLALSAASQLPSFPLAQQLHALALKLSLASEPFVTTSLMSLYFQFHGAHSASLILARSNQSHNPVSCTLLSNLYLKESKPTAALQLFYQMRDSNVELDSVAVVTAAKACGKLKSAHDARKVHEIARKNGLEHDVIVGNSLVKMYLECGNIENARTLFHWMPEKDAISWTTMMSGFVENGGFNEGLKLFREMCNQGVKCNSFSVSAVLPACARMAEHKNGRAIHGHIVRQQLGVNVIVENALLDMHVKSGSVDAASKIFEGMETRDTISWTVMILGYSLHGRGELGLALFQELKGKARASPDQTTLAAALHACNTACMVEEGRAIFNLMPKPEAEHFALMAGLLSRAGLFSEAQAFINEHRLAQLSLVQRAVLDGCRIHRNVKMGKRIAEQLMEQEPLEAANYVLLSNFYASNGKWEMVKEMRDIIRDMGLKPKRAYSWIEVRNKVHVFGTGDVSHPRSEGIYWKLETLMKRMQEEGYVPREDFSLHDVDEERECTPCGHSEMLAISFGLISTKDSGAVRVTKNLRVCRNCHDSAKMMSLIVQREIVLKDPCRFHHLKNGSCSCKDMW